MSSWKKLAKGAESIPVDPSRFGLFGRHKEIDIPLGYAELMDLDKQMSLDKNVSPQIPFLSALANPETALRATNKLPEEIYTSAYTQDYMDKFPISKNYSKTAEFLLRTRNAETRGAEALMFDIIPKHKPVLGGIKDIVGVDAPLKYDPKMPKGINAYYDPNDGKVYLDPKESGTPLVSTVIHELAHAKVDKNNPKAAYGVERLPKEPRSSIKSIIEKGQALDLAKQQSGKHFNYEYAVPSLDFAGKEYIKKIQDIAKQQGYTRYPPERDPRFENNKSMTRILRWIRSLDK